MASPVSERFSEIPSLALLGVNRLPYGTAVLPSSHNRSTKRKKVAARKLADNLNPTSSPTIDLLAVISPGKPDTVHVWRVGGQLVHDISLRHGQLARGCCWKPDGNLLAVAWDDGFVRLVGLEGGKAVHQLKIIAADDVDAKGKDQEGDAKEEITYIAWATNRTLRFASDKNTEPMSATCLLLGLEAEGDKSGVAHTRPRPDLPREVTFLDVDTALPKVSPLPTDGGAGEDMFVFTTQMSLDFIFASAKSEHDRAVDVLVVGTSHGRINLTVYESFVIGTFDNVLPRSPAGTAMSLIGHGYHPDVSTHLLVLGDPTAGDDGDLMLMPMHLNFITSSPVDLSLLASKTTTLQNLIRYIVQTQIHLSQKWLASRDLPNRFLRSVKEDLASASEGSRGIEGALYHTVLTGHIFPLVKEWLTETVGERGLKRWTSASIDSMTNIRALIHENLLPALDRASIVLSRLLGLARFHHDGGGISSVQPELVPDDTIGFTPLQITLLLDMVSSLSLIGNRMLLLVMEELETFKAFAAWMKLELERQTSSSFSAEELVEKEAQLSHALILRHVSGFLEASPLARYIGPLSKDPQQLEKARGLIEGLNVRSKPANGSSLMNLLDEAVEKSNIEPNSAGEGWEILTNTKFLVDCLAEKAGTVLRNIAAAEKRNVQFGAGTRLAGFGAAEKMDVKVVVDQNCPDQTTGFIAIASKNDKDTIHIFWATFSSSAASPTIKWATIQIRDSTVLDMRFVDEATLHVLVCVRSTLLLPSSPPPPKSLKPAPQRDAETLLLTLPYLEIGLSFTRYDPSSAAAADSSTHAPENTLSLDPTADQELFSVFKFDAPAPRTATAAGEQHKDGEKTGDSVAIEADNVREEVRLSRKPVVADDFVPIGMQVHPACVDRGRMPTRVVLVGDRGGVAEHGKRKVKERGTEVRCYGFSVEDEGEEY